MCLLPIFQVRLNVESAPVIKTYVDSLCFSPDKRNFAIL